jgi:uncharacterized protein (DUF3820 family)
MPIPKLTDNDPMPSGKYMNYRMVDVPADYLIWLYENNRSWEPVTTYIKENLDALKIEIKKQQAR